MQGVLTELLSSAPSARILRQNIRWLLVPIQDPDGSVAAKYEHQTNAWIDPDAPSIGAEALAYSRYLVNYVNEGHTIDMAIALHNPYVENSNFFNVSLYPRQNQVRQTFNGGLGRALKRAGYEIDGQKIEAERAPFRLNGWCCEKFGSLCLVYEVNDRTPKKRLMLPELQGIGSVMAFYIAEWCQGAKGREWHQLMREAWEGRRKERDAYLSQRGSWPRDAMALRSDLMLRGY